MTMPRRFALALLAALSLHGVSQAQVAQRPTLDTAQIEQLTGLKGTFSREENVFKVSKPRGDIKVQVDGWTMPPFMGLTSWAAFTPATSNQAMLMGDTVVFEDEVNPAMSAALDAGLEVTALHNHFFFDQPKVYFMHIGGMGDVATLARAVKKVYDKIGEIRAGNPTPAVMFAGPIAKESKISPAPLEAVFGTKGQVNNGMFKIVVGRQASMHGIPIGNEMGLNTWAAFAGTDGEAVVDGDFAMLESELQPVLKAMRAEGINIVAIHQHMANEQPRYMFLHYWGKGTALALAKAVKKALDAEAATQK
ncbi:DUF1259 domain-containing protein [Cupriavidus neocaledonicus]|uniref:DUF1259 domain-containing protein n=1 Tax=Cupriavidus neocaledonicus TaxID=1040979 RepID=A0A375H794_9BURK|nr:DUF1259 domain-containing protein [Cupriavidus neocaledonicus]SOZ38412.1 conserved exported hypothetical protein [Cupriavidus neocaledonicus]SPD46746.1 conserved exported protein of unknown function [Cupriavidus neocaledonicus]